MGSGFFGLPKDERSKDSVQRRTPETETPVDLMPTSEGVAMCAVPLMPRSLASPDPRGARAGGAGASEMEAAREEAAREEAAMEAAGMEDGCRVGARRVLRCAAVRCGAGGRTDHGLGRRLGEEVRHGVVAHVGAADAPRDGEDGGPGAREVGAVCARLDGDLDDGVVREHVRAVRLVQAVLHGVAQRVELAGREAVDEHARARDVVDAVLVAQVLGQRLARLGGAHLLVRDEEHAPAAARG